MVKKNHYSIVDLFTNCRFALLSFTFQVWCTTQNSFYVLYNKNKLESVSRIWASLISIRWFDYRLKPIFTTASSASKNDAQFSMVKFDSKIIISIWLSKSVTHSVETFWKKHIYVFIMILWHFFMTFLHFDSF